jgi:Eukaryotic elongation factor 5A hypusine, DNA-binding OB fold
MTQDGAGKDDVKVPESELGQQLEAEFNEGKDVRRGLLSTGKGHPGTTNLLTLFPFIAQLYVTIVSAMGEEQAISFKEAPVCLALSLFSNGAAGWRLTVPSRRARNHTFDSAPALSLSCAVSFSRPPLSSFF